MHMGHTKVYEVQIHIALSKQLIIYFIYFLYMYTAGAYVKYMLDAMKKVGW